MRPEPPESSLKVVLVGDCGVGKTSITRYYTKSPASNKPTVTANSVHCLERVGGCDVRFDLWDTAGQESYKCLVPVYARGEVLALVVFDRSSQDSFRHLSYWSEFLKNGVALDNFIVVGKKSDLAPETTNEEVQQWCEACGADYIETSAKTGSHIDSLFQLVARKVLALTRETMRMQRRPSDSGIILLNAKAPRKTFCPCFGAQ
jgi:small GTP-binding protein